MPVRTPFFRAPTVARVLPFVLFILLTAAQGKLGPASAFWFYLAKTVVGFWLIWEIWPLVPEMRLAVSWEAVVVGVAVVVMWVGIDSFYPKTDQIMGWLGHPPSPKDMLEDANPNLVFGEHSALACFFLGVHLVGMTLVVPPLEEVFYRSFLYRYIARPDFLSVPMSRFMPLPFFVTILLFGLEHTQWLAGILCGAAYQWLVLRKNRLGDAIVAHALTNFLLGAWVIWRGAWNFW